MTEPADVASEPREGESAHRGDPRRMRRAHERPSRHERSVLILGGAGFVGTNLAHRLLGQGWPVTIYDNFSNRHSRANARWLHQVHADRVRIEAADIRDRSNLGQVVRQATHVYHLAAQVVPGEALASQRADLETNTAGVVNLLEAMAACDRPAPLIFASTHKVYGSLAQVPLDRGETRFEPAEHRLQLHGFDETLPLSGDSPYSCARACAEHLLLHNASGLNIPAVVLRVGSTYGPYQLACEEQGWINHLLASTLRSEVITVYGDGRQVRDALWIDDLVDALVLTQMQCTELTGQIFNVGGGPAHSLSIIELLNLIQDLCGRKPSVTYDNWRFDNQRYFTCDHHRFTQATGWIPRVGIEQGLSRLRSWLINAAQQYGPAWVDPQPSRRRPGITLLRPGSQPDSRAQPKAITGEAV